MIIAGITIKSTSKVIMVNQTDVFRRFFSVEIGNSHRKKILREQPKFQGGKKEVPRKQLINPLSSHRKLRNIDL
jgi:hypothetical protein